MRLNRLLGSLYQMPAVLSPAEERVVLWNGSWETYKLLLVDLEDQSVPHLTFDQGVLEIMRPYSDHEEYKGTISLLVDWLRK